MSNQWKPALSTAGKIPNEELFFSYAQAGLGAMEISLAPDAYDSLDYESLLRLSEQYGIELWSFHLPFDPFETVDISRPELSEYTISRLMRYMKRACEIGIRRFVIHASGEPVGDEEREARMAHAKKSLLTLADYAKELGCVIAVEDLPRTCLGRNSGEIMELISMHDHLFVCLDTNHLLGEDLIDFIRLVGHKIITLHISDYDGINERHWLPGEGIVDWKSVIDALRAVGYEGCWLYELRFEAPWSIDRERDLTVWDFRANYDALMEGRTPPVLGTPKPNLGMWEAKKS